MVLGELTDTRASRALKTPNDLNYIELEYSGNLNQQTSIEFSLERLLSSDFVTGEVRYQTTNEVTYAAELIDKVDSDGFKFVASIEKTFRAYSQSWEVFTYYSYVTDNFGDREALTEDFLATGHGVALELESSFNLTPLLSPLLSPLLALLFIPHSQSAPLNWFTKFEAFKGNTRVQLGVKYNFKL